MEKPITVNQSTVGEVLASTTILENNLTAKIIGDYSWGRLWIREIHLEKSIEETSPYTLFHEYVHVAGHHKLNLFINDEDFREALDRYLDAAYNRQRAIVAWDDLKGEPSNAAKKANLQAALKNFETNFLKAKATGRVNIGDFARIGIIVPNFTFWGTIDDYGIPKSYTQYPK